MKAYVLGHNVTDAHTVPEGQSVDGGSQARLAAHHAERLDDLLSGDGRCGYPENVRLLVR
jgi:hypothetical protein